MIHHDLSRIGAKEDVQEESSVGITCLDVALDAYGGFDGEETGEKGACFRTEALHAFGGVFGLGCVDGDQPNGFRLPSDAQSNGVAIDDAVDHRSSDMVAGCVRCGFGRGGRGRAASDDEEQHTPTGE